MLLVPGEPRRAPASAAQYQLLGITCPSPFLLLLTASQNPNPRPPCHYRPPETLDVSPTPPLTWLFPSFLLDVPSELPPLQPTMGRMIIWLRSMNLDYFCPTRFMVEENRLVLNMCAQL